MGNSESTEKLGERVIAGKRKLEQDRKFQIERYAYLKANSPELLNVIMTSVADSFKSCSPFLEPILLLAWYHDPNKCKKIVLNACRRVFSAPIEKNQYQWFKEYVFQSSIWFLRAQDSNLYMYQELLDISKEMSRDIIMSMDAIYEHLCVHKNWKQVTSIKTDPKVLRQDDPKVGLLSNEGFKNLFESKTDDEKAEDMKTFIDSNLAINILTSTAKNINNEFQNHIKTVMGHWGSFKAGPTKQVGRCVSKLENDYGSSQFPKSAKLLDLVRCSVTFNTVDQLINGYNGLIKHINNNNSIIELARIKNGFSSDSQGGYRDIKVNVIYKSQINPGLNMVCEIQLMLINYLEEKKRIHKLYSILREEIYFQLVVQKEQGKKKKENKELRDLQFVKHLDVAKEVKMDYNGQSNAGGYLFGKCSPDSETDLLGIEGLNWFGIVDMKQKKSIFETKRDAPRYSPWYARMTHAWIKINHQKYLSVQMNRTEIQMFKVVNSNNKYEFIEDSNYRISIENNGQNIINYCAFDREFESILLVINDSEIQKRSMQNINNITARIRLQEKIKQSSFNQLNLSFDGSVCALGGGGGKNYFYFIDINENKQYKMTSNVLSDTYAPCFINGATNYLSMGDKKGRIEIWDIKKRTAVKVIDTGVREWMSCSASTNNILAISGDERKLRLYDVSDINKIECFYLGSYDTAGGCLHLTSDLKYLTISGVGGTQPCTVLEIK